MAGTTGFKHVVIAGGSGFLGTSLAQYLAEKGHTIALLSRRPPKIAGPWSHHVWDGRSLGDWRHVLNGADGLVNLTGRSVDCIKTPAHCDEILRSRVEATNVLGLAIRSIDTPPPVWVQMSTAHIYGDPPTVVCDEDSPPGFGLAPTVGQAWEAVFETSRLPSQRAVVFRTSFVLGRNRGAGGGAFSTLAMLTRFGLGGTIGSGTQGMSWIHECDMNRLFERALFEQTMQGTYVASSPNPVSQREFMRELRKASGMPIGLPAYSWMVRFGARWLLRTDPDLALYGRYVVSKRLVDELFTFVFPQIGEAFLDLLKRRQRDGQFRSEPAA